MRLLMVIPSYWSRPGGTSRPGDAIYDHPTPLDQRGTLGRTLRSVAHLAEHDFSLAVVAAPTAEELAEQTRARVTEIVRANLPGMPTYLFGTNQLHRLRRANEGLAPEPDRLLSLRGYGPIRNIGLVLAQLHDADAVIFIDDDEVFDDPAFIHKVREGLARGISGLAGYYVDADGNYLLCGEERAWQRRWGKLEAMNHAFEAIIGAPPRFKPTPFVFGGNMVITKELFRTVPFDPLITRGEDIDYLINARCAGSTFWLDNSLAITHLPPPHAGSSWRQLRQDVARFVYQREKIRCAGLDPAELDPYPGPYLTDELEARVEQTARLMADAYLQSDDVEGARMAQKIRTAARAQDHAGTYAAYRAFSRRWERLMVTLESMNFADNVMSIT